VVVAVGETVVELLPDVVVNVPGVMAMLVAPVILNARVLPDPGPMLAGLAVNESIAGGLITVTVTWAVAEPAEFVAVNV
jgi:hypothetical protein